MPFKTSIDAGIAEVVFDFPPVNAFKAGEWLDLGQLFRELSVDRARELRDHRGRGARLPVRGRREGARRGRERDHHGEPRMPGVLRGDLRLPRAGDRGRARLLPRRRDRHRGLLRRGDRERRRDLRTAGDRPRCDGRGDPPAAPLPGAGDAADVLHGRADPGTRRRIATGALEAVVPREELLPRARELAAKIASKSPLALRLAKESLNGIELLDLKRSYRYEQGFTLELYGSGDSQEARDAFVEKRDASFDD